MTQAKVIYKMKGKEYRREDVDCGRIKEYSWWPSAYAMLFNVVSQCGILSLVEFMISMR